MSELLRLEKISKSYGRDRVLVEVSLSIRQGEIIVVRGRSGVGKTTLAKIAAMLVKPDRGRVVFMGRDVASRKESQLASIRLRYIGYIDQFYRLIPGLTVLENVELPLKLLGVPRRDRRRRALEVLSKLGIEDKAYAKPLELSGGERQRAAIARALVKNPALIVADEPFSNLDEKTAEIVVKVFREYTRAMKTGILVTTTDLTSRLDADKDYILATGKLVSRK